MMLPARLGGANLSTTWSRSRNALAAMKAIPCEAQPT